MVPASRNGTMVNGTAANVVGLQVNSVPSNKTLDYVVLSQNHHCTDRYLNN